MKRRQAIFFGQNCVDPQSPEYDGWSGILNGCVNDARDLAIAFANMGFVSQAKFSGINVAGPSIPWVTTLECTREAWHQSHLDFQADAAPGDLFIIGDSGHGGTYATAGGQGETLCFADGQLPDGELFDLMCRWPAGVAVVYIFDTCHAGGMDRDRLRFSPKCAPRWVSDRNPFQVKRSEPPLAEAQIIQLCASQADETASDGPQNGVFTGTFLAVWDQARREHRSLTWRDWFRETSKLMAAAFPGQRPDLNLIGSGAALVDQAIGAAGD